ncbi:acetyl-CoA C-acetyltransferase [Palleronia salina]|uniref:Acetyl-CoA C-acetyltransferase n=1 Tax=Palleronia salina TaxID=313368 RepID=A0A1M6JNY2_9RHOB|nr:hypothetical protein [Palleronia salina]SHJ48263.1 acetyl-CoA C-acetyltransferase [Palleronia salina]
MTGVAILSACRSPVAPRGGALAGLQPHEIAAPVIRVLLERAGRGPDDVDELICANALGAGGNPARLAALASGLPLRVAGLTIDRQCVGGLDAVLLGAALIRSGAARCVIAGGAESYSRRPLRATGTPDAPRFYDRPPFAPAGFPDPDLAAAADALATRVGLSKAEMDAFAAGSHAKALAHPPRPPELVPMAGLERDSFTRALTPRIAARAQRLVGQITAANSAVAADAAAFVLLARSDDAPTAPRIAEGVTLGADPANPAAAPDAAIAQVLDRAGIGPGGLSRIELMEAYAAQAMATARALSLPEERMNVGGGALARGHPIGASGAVNLVRLVHELACAPGLGLAAIAAAGGLGTAVLIDGRARDQM